MKLNLLERLFIVNPVRPLVQSRIEARQLFRMGGPAAGGRALENGCGGGAGIDLVCGLFGAAVVDVFDIDRRMVELTRRRRARETPPTRAWVGNVRQILVKDESCDAIFNFGILPWWTDEPAWGRFFGCCIPEAAFTARKFLRAISPTLCWGG